MVKKIQRKRRILSAYDAWYFLREHPKLNRHERDPLTPEEAEEARGPKPPPPPGDELAEIIGKGAARRKGYRVVKDAGGNYWRDWHDVTVPAVDENLDIHYAQVDERGRDSSKNVRVEVWLELGPVEWGHHQPEYEIKEGARCYKMHFHDVDLDTGAPTFDEALIKLARKVQKKYGDYPAEGWQLFRPKPPKPQRVKTPA
jgi:hypothetical protein